jgi:beta-N-acetylhexosaminidase
MGNKGEFEKRSGWVKGGFVARGVWVLMVIALLLLTPASSPGVSGDINGPDRDGSDWVEERIRNMTLEQKVGQMFMVGFGNPGDQPAYEINDQIRTLIQEKHVGGVILFGRNVESPEQVGKLTGELQTMALSSSSGIPLFVAIDQEGGPIIRIRKGVTLFPGNMALGATRDPNLAYEAGRITGMELRAMGINMNLAPVVDLNNNARNPVIGVRSFGEDPTWVAKMAEANIRGYHDGAVLTAVKHFPGHGDTAVDSHLDLPTISRDRKRMEEADLVPFRRAIAQGADAVMSAHVTFPAFEPSDLPATLSRRVLTDLLRNELGFDGVIMTDDMEMGAIAKRFGSAKAAVRAIRAGADMVLVCHTLSVQKESIEAVTQAVRSGEISEARIDRSVRRILELKSRKLGSQSILRKPQTEGDRIPERVGRKDFAEVARKVAQRAVTLVRDDQRHLPLDPQKQSRVLVLSAEGASELGEALRGQGFDPAVRKISLSPGGQEILEASRMAVESDAVIIGTFRAQMHPEQGDLVRALRATRKPVIVLGLDTPYDPMSFPEDGTYLALYSSHPVSLEAAAKAVAGKIPLSGRLPVTIPDMYPAGHGHDLEIPQGLD